MEMPGNFIVRSGECGVPRLARLAARSLGMTPVKSLGEIGNPSVASIN